MSLGEFLVGDRALACVYSENRREGVGGNRIHKAWGALSLIFFRRESNFCYVSYEDDLISFI